MRVSTGRPVRPHQGSAGVEPASSRHPSCELGSFGPTFSRCDILMHDQRSAIDSLEAEIASLETRLQTLKIQLANAQSLEAAEASAQQSHDGPQDRPTNTSYPSLVGDDISAKVWKWPLQPEEYRRYSRQLVVPEIGLGGKCHEKISSSVMPELQFCSQPDREL